MINFHIKNVLKTDNKLEKLILFFAIITPALPKLKVHNEVTIYLLELILLVVFPFFIVKIRLKFQWYLLLFWSLIGISTVISWYEYFDTAGILRVFKGLIYIPLGYIGYKHLNDKHINWMMNIFIIASLLSVLVIYLNVKENGFNIWDVKTIGSGLSNRYIEIPSFKFGTIEKGAHGIWGNYCVLSVVWGIFLYRKKNISIVKQAFIIMLGIIGVGLSVSREASITLALTLISFLFLLIGRKKYVINTDALKIILIIISFATIAVLVFGEQIPIVKKMTYTLNSIDNTGTESNAQLRLNAWSMFAKSLIHNPEYILTGYGYNSANYQEKLASVQNNDDWYVAIPESIFIMSIGYGGVFTLITICVFFVEIFKKIFTLKEKWMSIIFLFYFTGLLIGNAFSGASILADLLYGQILLSLGYICAKNNETRCANTLQKY